MDLPHTIGLMGPPPRPGGRPGVSVIRPGLLVGEYPLPEDAAWLRDEHGVTTVVSLQDDAGERVSLHCNAGLNRAPTAAIAYLHVREGLSLEAARDEVKQRRHCVPYMRVLEVYFGGGAG